MTLWDLLTKPLREAWHGKSPSAVQAAPAPKPRTAGRVGAERAGAERAGDDRAGDERAGRRAKKDASAGARYDAVARELLATHQIRVRKWRTSMSGIAWYVTYRDGRVQRLIEAPKPKGPMSVAVFLHEVGHHAIGFDVYKPRCLEEYHAWRFALAEMERRGLNITDAVRRRVDRSLRYAVAKAERRGIKMIPPELVRYSRSADGGAGTAGTAGNTGGA